MKIAVLPSYDRSDRIQAWHTTCGKGEVIPRGTVLWEAEEGQASIVVVCGKKKEPIFH